MAKVNAGDDNEDRKRLKEKLKVTLRSRTLNDEFEARRSTTTQDWPAEERLVGPREVLFRAMRSRARRMRCSTTPGWPALQCTQRQGRGAVRGRPEARRPHVRWAAFDRNGVLSVERATVSPFLNQDFQPSPKALPSRSCQQSQHTLATSTEVGGAGAQRSRRPVQQRAPPPAHPASRGWGDGRGYAVGGRGLGCCAGVCARYGVCVMDMGFRGRRGGVGGGRLLWRATGGTDYEPSFHSGR